MSEYESALISNAADVFGAMAAILGPDFAPAFGRVLPLIAACAEPSKTTNERSMAIGCFGEIIVGLKSGVTQYTPTLLEIISRGLQDSEPDVRSNSAFAIGVLVENSQTDLSTHVLTILTALQPFFAVPEGSPPALYNARDNAAGAMSRMISHNADAIPLDQVVPAIVHVMPLQFDPLENNPVYRAIFALFRTRSDVVMAHLDGLLPAFAYNLDPEHEDDTTPEVRQELRALVDALRAQVPDQIQAAGM